MKNVLFTTTALVAMAGAAAADSHAGVSWAGDVEVGYNDVIDGGFYVDGGLDLTGFVALENDVTVEVTFGADIYGPGSNTHLEWDDFPTLVVTTNLLTFTAGTIESAGADNYSAVDGMGGTAGFFEENGEFLVRLDATFGDIAVAVSGVATNDQFGGPIDTLSVGASGSFGAVDFGIGYDDGGEVGVNVGTSLGSIDLDLAYQTDGVDNSIGLGVGATLGSVELAAYYAMNTGTDDAYGVSADASFGSVNVGAYWDADAGGASNFGVDLDMAVSDTITAYAGYDQADSFYVGAIMTIAEGAAVGASYADTAGADHGPEDFKDGISVWFSAEF